MSPVRGSAVWPVLARHRAVLVCAVALAPTAAAVLGGPGDDPSQTGLVPIPTGGRVPLWVVLVCATCLLLSPLLAPDFSSIEAASASPGRLLVTPLGSAHVAVAAQIALVAPDGGESGAVGLAGAVLAIALAASAVLRQLNWVAIAPAYVAGLTVLADNSVYSLPALPAAGAVAWVAALVLWWWRYRRLPFGDR